MKKSNYRVLLKQNLEQLEKSMAWLRRSYEIGRKIGIKSEYSEEEFDALETLVSRFARTTDLIIHKVFRSIDRVELEDGGTLLDVVNRAEKRGLIPSAEQIRLIKDLRNQIVHEYSSDFIFDVLEDLFAYIPQLFEIADSIQKYCLKYVKIDQ